MTTMIYTRTSSTENFDEYGPSHHVERETIVLTDPNAMARQVIELISMAMEYDSDWNLNGDEWFVEPSYAEACHFYAKGSVLEPLFSTYGHIVFQSSYDYLMPLLRDDQYRIVDFKTRVDCWSSTEFGGEEQEDASKTWLKHSERLEKQLSDLRTKIANGEAPHPSRDICWTYRDAAGHLTTITHCLHIVKHFTAETDGEQLTLLQRAQTKQEAEWKAHLAYMETPEGKAEEKARRQAEADLQTAMGEGGYTSYARNDDGTVTMWRD